MGALRQLKGLTIEMMDGWANPPVGYLGRTSSGMDVTHDTALAVGVVFRAVSLLSQAVAAMPLICYRDLPGGGRDRATDHPAYPLLHDSPTPGMTSFVWRETAMAHCLMWGNSYAELVRDGYDRLLEIRPLRPDRMTVRVVRDKRVYLYRNPDGVQVELAPRDVLHVPGLGYDGLVGYSVLSLMREDIGLYRAAHSYGSNFFRNNARPAVVLSHPKTLPPEVQEQLAAQMDRLRGSANAGKTVVLEDGLKFETLGIPPEDAQFMETRRFQVGELSRWFGVPPHMVGDVDRSTSWGTGIESQATGFLRFTLDPGWLVRWEQQLKMQVLEGWPGIHAEFLRDALLRADTLTRYTAYNLAVNTGWMLRSEARDKENLNPIEGLDQPVLPVNIAEIETDGAGSVTNVRMENDPGGLPIVTARQPMPTNGHAPAPEVPVP